MLREKEFNINKILETKARALLMTKKQSGFENPILHLDSYIFKFAMAMESSETGLTDKSTLFINISIFAKNLFNFSFCPD